MAPTQERQPMAVKHFFDAVSDAAVPDGAGRKRVTTEAAQSLMADSEIRVPASVQALLAKYPEKAYGPILDAVLSGARNYKRDHGVDADPTLIEFALHNAYQATRPLSELTGGSIRLDNATNTHHDQLSLQPANAVVSIMAQFAEAVPYAAYLPADTKSNEARLAILSNLARSDFGDYLDGASLDGIAGGGGYLDSERVCLLSSNGGGGTALTYVVTQKASEVAGGIAAGAGNAAMPLLRGRTCIVVNGFLAARETASYGSGSNTIAGSATIASTSYAISGTVNSDTGAISITSSPALPAGVFVEALAYIDFEKAPTYAPKVGVDATIYSLFARASRGIVQNTIDSSTQMQNELGLDPRGQALLSLRNQYAQERLYRANAKMKRVAANNAGSWNYDRATQIAQKDISQLWLNLQAILGERDQQMANETVDHGIDTLFFGALLSAQLDGLPSTIWEPSGLTARPGVYRRGKLFGKYNAYYTPRGITEVSNTTSQILCVGRGTTVARNPIVMGDAVPPVFLPLAMDVTMVQGDGFYTRNFTEVNPHAPSARGAALISVTNIN